MTFDRSRSPSVQEHPDAYPGLGSKTESLGHRVADLALPVDEGEKVDRALGVTNGVQHRRKDLAPVAQHGNSIALGRRNPHDSFERASRPVYQFVRRQRRTSSAFIGHALLPLVERDRSRDLTR